jgi:predicted nucleotidyltransferase
MNPATDPRIDNSPLPAEVPRVLGALTRWLADSVQGVYLFGSFAAGGLHPQSDLDILVATTRPLTGAARLGLVAELLAISGRDAVAGPSRPLEVTLVVTSQVVPWRFPPVCDLLFGEWLRDDLAAERIAPPEASPDLAIVLTTLLQHHRVLAGPPASMLFEPVPIADLRRAIAACLPSLLENLKGDERNVILTLARMWVTLATDQILPKDSAAEWVLERLPAELSPVLELARAAYLGERGDDWSTLGAPADAFVQHAVAMIEASNLAFVAVSSAGR